MVAQVASSSHWMLIASSLNKENSIWHQKANSPILVSHLFSLLVQYIRLFADLYLGCKKSFRPTVILLSGVDVGDVSSLQQGMKGFMNWGHSQRERSPPYNAVAVGGGQWWAQDPAARGMRLLLASLLDELLVKA